MFIVKIVHFGLAQILKLVKFCISIMKTQKEGLIQTKSFICSIKLLDPKEQTWKGKVQGQHWYDICVLLIELWTIGFLLDIFKPSFVTTNGKHPTESKIHGHLILWMTLVFYWHSVGYLYNSVVEALCLRLEAAVQTQAGKLVFHCCLSCYHSILMSTIQAIIGRVGNPK